MSLPIAPVTNGDIRRASKEEKELAQSYLAGLIEYAKWTSTVAIAAGIWIGNGLSSLSRLPLYLSIASLVLIILSLVIAVYAVRRVLTSWAIEWKVAKEDYSLLLLKKLKALRPEATSTIDPAAGEDLERKERIIIDRLVAAIEESRPLSDPGGYRSLISWHVVLLVGALFLFILAKIIDALILVPQ